MQWANSDSERLRITRMVLCTNQEALFARRLSRTAVDMRLDSEFSVNKERRRMKG